MSGSISATSSQMPKLISSNKDRNMHYNSIKSVLSIGDSCLLSNQNKSIQSNNNFLNKATMHKSLIEPRIPKEPRITVKLYRKIRLEIKLETDCRSSTNITLLSKLVIMIDQAINCSNLKINSLNLSIINDITHSDLDHVVAKFYKRLKRHTKTLEYLKLDLGSNTKNHRFLSGNTHEKLNAVKLILPKLINLKLLSLNIQLDPLSYIEGSKILNNLYKCIVLYLKNLQSLRLIIDNDTHYAFIPLKLTTSWSYIRKLKNLVSFTLELKNGNFICTKSSMINLLMIMKYQQKLKKYHISFDYLNQSIDITPFQNFEFYFGKLYTLESLKIDIPIGEEQFQLDINTEFVKAFKKYKNLKEIHLVCGDKSLGFRDKLKEIFECLGELTELQNVTIKYHLELQNELLKLAHAINQMQKLEKLKLHLEYTGEEIDIFDDFIAYVKFSPFTLKYLWLTIKATKNSWIFYTFWKSFAESLPHNTLELLHLSLEVEEIYMENHGMEFFTNKLAKNLNLSSLKLKLDADIKFNGECLIWIPKILQKLNYIKEIELYYHNVYHLTKNYFDIMQNSLKNKHMKVFSVIINHETYGCIFPSKILNNIIKILNYNDKTINRFQLKIPIYAVILESEKNKILNFINSKQIPLVKINLQEYIPNINQYIFQYIIYPKLSPYKNRIWYEYCN